MAGGIDWFRWHHGSATDPKFRLVAKRAGARVSEVLAVWACLLEAASAAEDRGNVGDPDFEALDLALDMDDGCAARIYRHLCDRDVIDAETGRVVAWEKRQPKRERPDDSSAERTRAYRAKQRQPELSDAPKDHVTPRDASDSQETPRGEESREEHSEAKASGGEPPVDAEKQKLYAAGKALLASQGMAKTSCGAYITKLAKDFGQSIAMAAVQAAVAGDVLDAREYLVATCQRMAGERNTVASDAAAKTSAALAEQARIAKESQSPSAKAAREAALAGIRRVA